MSSTSLTEVALLARIRERLNQENVKLWTEPFYREATKTVVDSEIMALASRYAMEFELVETEVVECLLTLQRNSIERVSEQAHFKSTGLATVRIKFSAATGLGDAERIQINLKEATGKDLKARIAELASVEANRLKLICVGRVISETSTLESQNVKNGSQIMVLVVVSDQEAFQKAEEDQFRQLEETRGAADFLAGRNQSENFSLELTNQHGERIDLPESERKSLAIALALHDKGRSALKLGEFAKGLVFLLEADGVYSQCQSGILESVDNYGLLNLDIAWCYLCLQSIAELPAAEVRLSKCEKALQRSYGENMERVIALKGSFGWEAALFVRLHLLQGVSAYHSGQIEKSKFLLGKAEGELQRLMISDEQLADLINMGYKTGESRMALRATFGNLQAAVDWIIRRREEKQEVARREENERLQRQFQKKLGFCANGDPVNAAFWRSLKEMGFNSNVARAALKRSNNELNEAIHLAGDIDFVSSVIAELPSVATQAPATSAAQSSNPNDQTPTSSSLASALALPTVEELISLAPETISEEQLLRNQEEAERSQRAYEALSKDVCSESEYIDLTLSAETSYLNQYKALLRI